MATEKRLVDANDYPCNRCEISYCYKNCGKFNAWLENTVDAVEVPCKIGDFVWAIRSFKGQKHPQRGIVGDMFFTKDMKLMIVVKYVARGEWGKTVFATDKEAYKAIGEGRTDGCTL